MTARMLWLSAIVIAIATVLAFDLLIATRIALEVVLALYDLHYALGMVCTMLASTGMVLLLMLVCEHSHRIVRLAAQALEEDELLRRSRPPTARVLPRTRR